MCSTIQICFKESNQDLTSLRVFCNRGFTEGMIRRREFTLIGETMKNSTMMMRTTLLLKVNLIIINDARTSIRVSSYV